jgi:hypothetical protein
VNTFLPFVDVPLRAGGSYVLTADLDLGPTPTLAAAHWIQAVTDFATAHGSDVAYLLSTVGDAVHTHAPADYASFESAVPHLTTTVQTDLAMRGALPVQVLSQFAADTAMVVQSPTLTLAVDVAAPSGAMTNVTTLAVRSASLSLDPLTPDVHVDDATLSLASSGTGTIAVSGGDRASVSLRGLSMPFPTVARAAADALLARLGVSTTRDWVRAEVSCSHVAGLLVSSTGACDSSCVITACQSALDTLAQQLDQSIARMGSTHVSVGFDSEGPIAGVPGGLRIASIGPAPLLGSFDDDPTAVVLGVLSMQSH